MENNIVSVTLGIRHRRSFRVPEIAGKIVDSIVHDSNSPFYIDKFDKTDILVNGAENRGRVLLSKDDENSLVVDVDSVVLTLKSSDISSTIKNIKEEFIPYIAKNIFSNFKIENINRLGVIFEFSEKDSKNIDKLISKSTNNIFTQPDHLDLRFAEKDIATDSLVKKDILDYINNIISIQKRNDQVYAKFDHQFYYSPEIKSISDVDFEMFLNNAQDKLKSRFFDWLNSESYEEAE